MTTKTITECPEWCTSTHENYDASIEEDIVHFKKFGKYSDGTIGTISVWAQFIDSKLVDTGVDVEYIEMENSNDLRDVAEVCLEAAKWMDENLGIDHDQETTSK